MDTTVQGRNFCIKSLTLPNTCLLKLQQNPISYWDFCFFFSICSCVFLKDFHNSYLIQSLLCINDAWLSEAAGIIRYNTCSVSVIWEKKRKLFLGMMIFNDCSYIKKTNQTPLRCPFEALLLECVLFLHCHRASGWGICCSLLLFLPPSWRAPMAGQAHSISLMWPSKWESIPTVEQ